MRLREIINLACGFWVLACFCGGYSNRVKRLRRLSGNFILLKDSFSNKGLPFRARPSQSGLPGHVGWGGEVIGNLI